MQLLDLIFPKSCLGCGKEGVYICASCVQKVPILKPACPYCEKPSIDGFTHTRCAKKYGMDGLTSVFKYEGIIKKAIQTLKYKYATEIVQELCGYYLEKLKDNGFLTRTDLINQTVLIPIPIYWYRQNVRGFNQSEEVGKLIAKELKLDFVPDLLIRCKSVKPQAGLTIEERKTNLNGVFSLNPDCVLSTGYSVLLFDDVFTTGSTLHEACKVLKRAGVAKVWGLTIAR